MLELSMTDGNGKKRPLPLPKNIYVRLTRARISAKTKSWETAQNVCGLCEDNSWLPLSH